MFIVPCMMLFGGNTLKAYIISIFLMLAIFTAVKVLRILIFSRLKQWAKQTKTMMDDFLVELIHHMLLPVIYFAAFYVSVNTLILHPLLKKTVDTLGTAVLTVFIVRLIIAATKYGLNTYWQKREKNPAMERSINGIVKVIQILIWALGIVFFLDNLGFKISAVIAGLGIGGIAVALAAQTILGDLFSYFAILFDRPFEIGDFIIIEDFLGTIEHIGIK
ncbi:MAG: mechanosensitive ion channel domain-containing protein, partial [Candidatus Omnitrophota bacterium]